MICIDSESVDPQFNLAAEEYLLKNRSETVFMLYRNEPAIILGRHQNIDVEINEPYVKKNKIKVLRRLSGGGSVYHDLGNFNLTFISDSNHFDFSECTEKMIRMLGAMGLQAEADMHRSITLHGLKISGSAQCVYKNRTMYHATLLFDSDLEVLNHSLLGDESLLKEQRRSYVRSRKMAVTNIAKYLNPTMDLEDCNQFILKYFLEEETGNCKYHFNSSDLAVIDLLKASKYHLLIACI